MNEVSPKILKTVQTLAQIAAELRQGKDFNTYSAQAYPNFSPTIWHANTPNATTLGTGLG